MLDCCQDGGCWASRCQTVGDGDPKDTHNLCKRPVQLTPTHRIPRCQDMITAADVIRRIEMYLSGGLTGPSVEPAQVPTTIGHSTRAPVAAIIVPQETARAPIESPQKNEAQ